MRFEIAVLLVCCFQCVLSDCGWWRCRKVGKDSTGKEKKTDASLPCDFELFDQNQDDVIDIEEFTMKSPGMDTTNLQKLFDTVDNNDDKLISSTEYEVALDYLHDQGLLGSCH